VGDVVEFSSYRKDARNPQLIARLERELSLPTKLSALPQNVAHPALNANRWRSVAKPPSSIPLTGIAIVACAILAYAIVALHVTGQAHYSARANLQPPVWSDD
jgi:hypothetical protein